MWGEKHYRKNKDSDKEKLAGNSLTASRARGIMALISALFLFQAGLLVLNKCNHSTENEMPYRGTSDSIQVNSHQQYGLRNKKSRNSTKKEMPGTLFYFNPNTITIDSLMMLGMTRKQAAVIIKYRTRGGRFRRKEDFAKMYTVSEKFYKCIESYILIKYPDIKKNYENSENTIVKSETGSIKTDNKQQEKLRGKYSTAQINSSADCMATDIKSANGRHYAIVNLNTADSSQLVSLYGIGPYFAVKIIDYRERLGSYAFVEQLLEIRGFDEKRLNGIRDRIEISENHIVQFSLDTVSISFLKRHPYIGPYTAQGIILLRESLKKHDKPSQTHITPQLLLREKIVSEEQARKLMFYCK